jgi:TolA-binding protein
MPESHCSPLCRVRIPGFCLLSLLFVLLGTSPLAAQVPPDKQADMLLTSARNAYNEKNYPFAIAKFREFLGRFGGHKTAPAARYGLALCLIEGPDKNYTEARDLLQGIAGNKDLPEHPSVLYHLGLSLRSLGIQELAQAVAKPQESIQRRASARQHFEEAAKHFAAAEAAYTKKAGNVSKDVKELPLDLEWAARARCDLAEMQLRTLRSKEAQTTAVLFVQKDALLAKSRYRELGSYYHGFASFLLKDYLQAGKSLNSLKVCTDPVFGTHARYLLGRIHHLSDERAEAAQHYEGVLSDYAKNKKVAAEALKRPDLLKKDPVEKSRLEALVKDPTPEHVAQASFYLGVLLYEGGRFGDARTRFAEFAKLYPSSRMIPQAQLRIGFCQVQLKEFGEALKTLQAIPDKDQRLADQILFWIGKAKAGAADPGNPALFELGVKGAIDSFRLAAERAQQLIPNDPEAKERRGEILLEMGDAQQSIKQYKEAAATYGLILKDKLLPRREELTQRQITALHLAGDYNESDKLCEEFPKTFPQSTLLPAVLFRYAENSFFRTRAAEKNTNLPDRPKTLAKLYDETAKRYETVVSKFPEFTYVNLARYGLAMTWYRKGDLEKARQALDSIPQADRTGDLAIVPYLLADCLIRLAPAKAEDALTAGKVEEGLKTATELLDAFISAYPKGNRTPDALLKLGLCYQRLATVYAQPQERIKVLQKARGTYDKLINTFGQHPLRPQAILERARCMAQTGNPTGAVNELRQFTKDQPQSKTAIAPMALLQLATLLRGQNKAAEAVTVLAQGRQQHEANLLKDPEKVNWAVLLQYHHGIALRESGKLADARTIFDQLLKQFPNRPEAAEAALRSGQCLKDEGQQKLVSAHKQLASAKKPEEFSAANKLREEGLKTLRDTVQYFQGHAEQLKSKQPASEARARVMYEIAWLYRDLAGPEVEAARAKMTQDLLKKLGPDAAKEPPPEVPLSSIPLQPSEQKARQQYQALIDAFPELPLGVDARFELAELYAERNDHDQAIKILTDALDKEPPQQLTDKIRIRLGVAQAAKGNLKSALVQFDAVAQNVKSPLAGQAHYRAGECLMQQKEWAEAVKRLSIFRDKQEFQNLPGVSDRGLLRLGHAYDRLKDWDKSRQAQELLVSRFNTSPLVHEARYGMGWAFQQQKRYDDAVNAYNQVTNNNATETAARAQLGIGLCRLEQKRFAEAATALLVVPFTYEFPELNAEALVAAARALTELKQADQAARVLRRVLRDYPKTRAAAEAKERLGEGKGS